MHATHATIITTECTTRPQTSLLEIKFKLFTGKTTPAGKVRDIFTGQVCRRAAKDLLGVLVLHGLHWGVRLLGSVKRLWLHPAAAADWTAMHQLQVSLHRQTLMLFDCTGESSWWQARWSALMTCPSPPVRASSLPPAVTRTSSSSMSEFTGRGVNHFKTKKSL